MFGLFRKKTQLEQLIAKDGIEHATERVSEIVSGKMPTREVAYRFRRRRRHVESRIAMAIRSASR